MAGRGSRFQEVGYALPKPLIPVHGQPMIRLVIENLRPAQPHRFIFLCLAEHLEKYNLAARLAEWASGCEVVAVDQVTQGAACTVLLARHLIDNADPLMIANSDQWVDVGIDNYLARMEHESAAGLTAAGSINDSFVADGLIMTMRASDPKWSFVRFDDAGRVCEVVEKRVVSNEATVGIYNFRHGSDFARGADRMISKNLRVNNEFYVAPVYNELLGDGARITTYNVGQESDGMHGLGVPSDLASFVENPVSLRALPSGGLAPSLSR